MVMWFTLMNFEQRKYFISGQKKLGGVIINPRGGSCTAALAIVVGLRIDFAVFALTKFRSDGFGCCASDLWLIEVCFPKALCEIWLGFGF